MTTTPLPPGVAPVAQQPQVMVDMVPPATARDRWMYEQGRLAERDPRTHTAQQPQAEPLTDEQRLGWYAWRVKDLEEKLANAQKQPQAKALPPDPRPVIEMCAKALAEELAAWDIDPPLHHVKEASDACEAWLAAAAIAQQKGGV